MKIAEDMVTGNIGETMGKIELLILNLVLELAVKENIQILHWFMIVSLIILINFIKLHSYDQVGQDK